MLKGIDLGIPMGKEVEKRALHGLRSPSYLLLSPADNKSRQLRYPHRSSLPTEYSFPWSTCCCQTCLMHCEKSLGRKRVSRDGESSAAINKLAGTTLSSRVGGP